MSKLLEMLDTAIAQGVPDGAGAFAHLRKAIYLSRLGDVDAAKVMIATLRTDLVGARFAEAVAQANLADGVVLFCSGEYSTAKDKLRRAAALAAPAGAHEVGRASAAWLAHIAFNEGRIKDIAPLVVPVLQAALPTEHWILSRVASTVAAALHYCDRFDMARPWYDFARVHAADEGDDLTIDAVLHNMAAFRIQGLRLREVEGSLTKGEVERARLDLESSLNYDALKEPSSFRWSLPLQRAQLLMLETRIAEAAVEWARWHEEHASAAPSRLEYVACADYAYCLAHLGRVGESAAFVDAVAKPPVDVAIDEKALVAFRRAQLSHLAGNSSSARAESVIAASLLSQHRRAQQVGLAELADIQLPEMRRH